MNPRRLLHVKVIANGMSGDTVRPWLQDAQLFYTPITSLIVDVEVRSLVPKMSEVPGLALPIVDPDWYDEFITVPNLNYDIVILLTPKPKDAVTYGGVMTYANCGPWEITVFCDPPDYRSSVNGKDLGNSNALLIKHELSHAFFNMFDVPDYTHVAFYDGNPNAVLDKLTPHFYREWSFSDYLAEIKRKLNGALVALGVVKRTREHFIDRREDFQSGPEGPFDDEDGRLNLYEFAKSCLGKDISKTQNEYGCAEAVSYCLNKVFGDVNSNIVSTAVLDLALRGHAKFRQIETGEEFLPGDIIMAVTGQAPDPLQNGHVGVVAYHGVMSNNSITFKFDEHFTLESFIGRYRVQLGFPIRGYRRIK